MQRFIIVPLLAFLTASVFPVVAQAGRPAKKLIEYGWDVPYPDYVRKNIRKMEQRPFDGIIFRLRTYNHVFDTRAWTEKDLADQIADLKAIQWKRFTDNFLCLYAANRWKMDWFNDDQWKIISANMSLMARIAREAHCVGLCFDPEPYGKNPWAYPGSTEGKSFEQVEAMVRKRGAQFMNAVQKEMPRLRLLTFFQLSVLRGVLNEPDDAKRIEKLERQHYALLPAFLNGMLEAAGPDVQIIDGNEPSYYYWKRVQFYSAYHMMKCDALTLIDPQLWPKYRRQCLAGMALYMDQVLALRKPEGGFPSYFMDEATRLRWFEHNVYYALKSSDEYVWCYSERLNWWENRTPKGAADAIRSARRKLATGEPLGFDMKEEYDKATQKLKESVQKRVEKRTAVIHRLPAGVAAPKIDGDLSDAAWRKLPPLAPFLPQATSPRSKPRAATRAWVTYDTKNLYVAFRCEEPKIRNMRVVGAKKDDDIWLGDDVELLFSLTQKPQPYVHFIVNPKNVQWDGNSSKEGNDVKWNASWRSATQTGADFWTAELAIPWSALGGLPRPGTTRRANLCRQRTAVRELSSWSSVVTGFLDPELFGTWKFE